MRSWPQTVLAALSVFVAGSSAAIDGATGLSSEPDEVHVFEVTAFWGRIQPDRGFDGTRVRWDPVVEIMDGGAVHVCRAVRFERGDRVHPRGSRHEVSMSSVTGPHTDGVILEVAFDEDGRAPDAFLRFRSLPFSRVIPVRELAGLSEVHLIDETGNGLMMSALRRPPQPDPCASGFFGGRWARTGDTHGIFDGEIPGTRGRVPFRLRAGVSQRHGLSPQQRLRSHPQDLPARMKAAARLPARRRHEHTRP